MNIEETCTVLLESIEAAAETIIKAATKFADAIRELFCECLTDTPELSELYKPKRWMPIRRLGCCPQTTVRMMQRRRIRHGCRGK